MPYFPHLGSGRPRVHILQILKSGLPKGPLPTALQGSPLTEGKSSSPPEVHTALPDLPSSLLCPLLLPLSPLLILPQLHGLLTVLATSQTHSELKT